MPGMLRTFSISYFEKEIEYERAMRKIDATTYKVLIKNDLEKEKISDIYDNYDDQI